MGNGNVKSVTVECPACGATGLYKGMVESDGCAVVCQKCKGTGATELTFTPFTARKKATGIVRVFKDSCGYCHDPNDITTKEGVTIHFSDGGCTYKEWLAGADPKPVKDLYCPYLFERQSPQGKDHPFHALYKKRCEKHLSRLLGSRISTACPNWKYRDDCWAIWQGIKDRIDAGKV